MKNLIRLSIFLLIMVMLPGCFATKKRCLRLYPPTQSVDTVVHETIRDSIVIKDTTLFVNIPGITLHDSILVGPGNITSDTIILETDFARSMAWYRYPNIFSTLTQKDTTLQFQIDSLRAEVYVWKDRYTEILNKEVVPVKYVPTIYKVSAWAWIGVLVMIIFRALKRFKVV